MTWIIQSKDAISGRTGENRYQTEEGFRTALSDIFNDRKQQFVSAIEADGTILTEATARSLVGFEIGVSGVGETPIG